MNRQRYITVPLDKEAMHLYDMGEENIKDSLQWILTEKEFGILNDSSFFEKINNISDVLIDDYESEIIQGENLERAYEVVCLLCDVISNDTNEKLRVYIKTAIDRNTLIAFDF